MNTFIIEGRIGRDAETRYTNNGSAVTSVAVATDTGFGDNKKTMWVRCSIWGNQGVSLQQYLAKGASVVMSGELSESEFQANDGTTKRSLDLKVDRVRLTGSVNSNNNGQQNGQNQRPQNAQQQPQQYQQQQQQQQQPHQHSAQNMTQNTGGVPQPSNGAPFENEFDDDIPF